MAEKLCGCKVRTVVTDNARNIEKMCCELEMEDTNLVTYGCLAHVLNLPGQDLTHTAVMKHVVEVNKFFRNYHVPSSWLNDQLGAIRPQLPNEIRWKSQLICLESYNKNRIYFIKFIQDFPDDVDQAIVRKVSDLNLFMQVSDLANMLKPVAAALDKAQNDKTGIADVCDMFYSLTLEPALHDHLDKVQKRYDFAI